MLDRIHLIAPPGCHKILDVRNSFTEPSDVWPMPPLAPEPVAGVMGTFRLGPVTIPLRSAAKVSATSEGLYVLRDPRVLVQTTAGVQVGPDTCQIAVLRVGDAQPIVSPTLGTPLGLIRPGEKIEAVLLNNATVPANVHVVVESDGAREVHWGVDCDKHRRGEECRDCRWRTKCGHDECERSPEMERLCREEEKTALIRQAIHHTQDRAEDAARGPSAAIWDRIGGVGHDADASALWRPWNPLSR